jgi:CRISPR/Cas system-associated exonuclease Cas4 (RecB family)
MNVYALATEKLYGKLPKNTTLFYLKKDKTIVNKIEPSQLENVKKGIEEQVDLILQEDFHPTPTFQSCRRCDFRTICDSRKV